MLLWFVFGAIFGVWNVFQSPGLDFRLIAAGALLPELIDLPFGRRRYAHTLLAATLVLVVTMLATTGRGRRLRRRRALGLAIGWFAGLVLSAAWAHKEVFWWPAFGTTPTRRAAVRRRGRSSSSRSCSALAAGVVDVDALRAARRDAPRASSCARAG